MKTAAQELAEAAKDFLFFAGHGDGCRKQFAHSEWAATPAGKSGEPWECTCGREALERALTRYNESEESW